MDGLGLGGVGLELSRRGAILAEVAMRGRARAPSEPSVARVGLVAGRGAVAVEVGVAYSVSVEAVQHGLVGLGYDVGPDGADGKLGPKTAAAIKKYQKDHGLPQTGKIDDALKGGLSGAGKEAAAEAAKAIVASTSTDSTVLVVVLGIVLLLGGVAVWMLSRKGV